MKSSTAETARAEHPRVRRTGLSIPAGGLHLDEARMPPPEQGQRTLYLIRTDQTKPI